MADSDYRDWAVTASSNSTIGGGVNVAENCAMAGLNNMGRAIMAAAVGGFTFNTASGGDTYTATCTPIPGTYSTGSLWFGNLAAANTSSTATINFNALGNKTITNPDASALVVGGVNGSHAFHYDGTQMRCLNPIKGTGLGQLPGVATSSNATAGNIGEFIVNNTTDFTAVAMANATPATATTASLTAGDWDVWGSFGFIVGAATTPTAAFPSQVGNTAYVILNNVWNTGISPGIFSTGAMRLSLAVSTTVQLITQATFGGSTMSVGGTLMARRRR
jgi:hypothetical protein